MITKNDVVLFNNNYYSVGGVVGNELKIYPFGGGFQITTSTNNVKKTDLPNNKEIGVATVEGSDLKFDCICNPLDRWNGWAKPWFTKQVLKSVLADLNLKCKAIQHESNCITMTFEDFDVTIFKSKKLYYIDGWCWDFKQN